MPSGGQSDGKDCMPCEGSRAVRTVCHVEQANFKDSMPYGGSQTVRTVCLVGAIGL